MLSRIINPVNNLMKHSAAMPSLNAQAVQYRFSADGEESDSDFKKQTKVELTNENAQKIIEKWVTENNVVLFMKGTPLNPQCGYSNFVVEVLKKYGLNEYKSINVLQNPIIREQVKLYSKWPTYPQLYVAGQLVGGSDILYEMHKDQTLHTLLEEKNLI